MQVKNAYKNSKPERKIVLDNIALELGKDTATENAGRNGFNLQEMRADINGRLPDDVYDEEKEKSEDYSEALDTLKELDSLLEEKGLKDYSSFTSLLIQKFAEDADPVRKFNDLLLKINNADMADTNEAIKKITNIFSRTIIIEYSKHGDLDRAKESAYKKVFNRANQYLSSEKMTKSAQVYENPAIVAEKIKDIISVLISRFSVEAKTRAFPNLKNRVMKMNPSELASKKSPGGAAIGVSISLIKNILNGRDPHFIRLVINNLARIL
jgi:hypothetical protein